MWNTFFDFFIDFCMAFGLLKRALTFFAMLNFMLSYSQACKPHAVMFDMLLRALTVFDLVGCISKI